MPENNPLPKSLPECQIYDINDKINKPGFTDPTLCVCPPKTSVKLAIDSTNKLIKPIIYTCG